jgi:RNA polymerase sigma-70 factor, ECF subfamily
VTPTDTVPAAACAHRDHLLRYARRHLRDAALAEDVVHDVLAAVLAGQATFGHRSSLRTWLTGILKHKIVDAVRRQSGERSLDAMLDEDESAPPLPTALHDRADPCLRAEHRQTLRRALTRLQALPAPLRRTFELHVVLGHSTAEVCGALDITEGNLWVRVHRVRKELLLAA